MAKNRLPFLVVFLFALNLFAQSQPPEERAPTDPPIPPSEKVEEPEPEAVQPGASKIQPTSWRAKIVRKSIGDEGIEALTIPRSSLPVFMVFQNQKFRPMVEIPIVYTRPGWRLYVNGTTPVIKTTLVNQFKVFAYLKGQVNEFILVAKGPQKQRETVRYFIMSPDAQEFEVVSSWDALKFSLGGSYYLYKQTNLTNFYSWSGLLSIQYRSPEEKSRLGMAADVNITAVSIASNKSQYGPQIAQGIFDGLYSFSWNDQSRWRWQALAGASYVTMIRNGAPFGFKNLSSFEVGARTRYIQDTVRDWIGEFRYTPLGDSFLSQQRGLSITVARGWILKNLHRGELGVRAFDYRYFPSKGQTIQLQSLSYTFGYSF